GRLRGLHQLALVALIVILVGGRKEILEHDGSLLYESGGAAQRPRRSRVICWVLRSRPRSMRAVVAISFTIARLISSMKSSAISGSCSLISSIPRRSAKYASAIAWP